MAQLAAYFYSRDDAGLWVHHYGGNKVTCQLSAAETFALEQITDYPWSGDVKFVIRQAPQEPVALRLRVPGWAGRGEGRRERQDRGGTADRARLLVAQPDLATRRYHHALALPLMRN